MNVLRRLILTAFVSCTLISLIAQEWQNTKFDSIGITISSPEELVKNTQEAMTDMGLLQIESYGLSSKNDDNLLYQLIIISYPKESIPQDSLELKEVLLENLISQSIEESSGELIYSEPITLQKRQGIQWRLHTGTNISIKSKAFIDKDRVMIIQVMTDKEKSLNENINRFIESFRFLE